jgi:hypothetical protein
MQPEHVVIVAGAAEITGVVSLLDGRQPPYGLIETARFVEIGSHKLDAAHAADETGCHFGQVRIRRLRAIKSKMILG